ncbi:MAG: phosphomannose isomerase type II C-terminal cupin domain [Gammaproteobacteria bacterium]|nr:phosphomannose isomerase type II C-terminal cupin domain [Gammaproteobacteria bacterium]MCY4199083.1 phosphomannose isomerase type II C-terminal cupin domain [Gammaproteobacteria bacterium]MCY4278166.1 phosphomannose isomerase type II C-terminal cupin domain [Gammaproteobacteria bacterium]MCY4323781.1 phosphomannose isomerase type II C-terminal cupin domain [Gammaproteobacteria bacterium]
MAYSVGDSDTRPWGAWQVLAIGDGFVIKKIDVMPGARLSLQSHAHRSEHWTILHGSAEVTVGARTVRLGRDETVFIPAQTKHRIHNVGKTGLSFIEIQTGSILDESDIERFDDEYGRT